MAYSELIKNFDRIRDYMRQFYVYGFKSRNDYDQKSARSYDNERRRLGSWLGKYMGFRQRAEGKNVFLSVDSRAIPGNPLYNAFKAKSFTAGDVTLHFYILDLLRDGGAYNPRQITELLSEKYLNCFESGWAPDVSTVRKKLKEYESLGILRSRRQGKELVYSQNTPTFELNRWADTLAFFSEADPLGVIGSFLLDKLDQVPSYYRFKHHYILHALDSQILLRLLEAIGEHRLVTLTNASARTGPEKTIHTVYPLRIFISTQNGRQYLLCHHYRMRKLMFFRLDYIIHVEPGLVESNHEFYARRLEQSKPHLWGTSAGSGFSVDHLEMTIHHEPNEIHIPRRLEREKRNGTVEILDGQTCRYVVDVYDAMELLPWIRTFIGRIEKLECTNQTVVDRFYEDLSRMESLYGGEV